MRNPRRAVVPMNTADVPTPGDPLLTFYVDSLRLLEATGLPFVVGGAFAHSRYTGRDRDTKDLDVMLKREDVPHALAAFKDAGYEVEVPFPHWLGKVHRDGRYIDVVYSSGNGIVRVDDCWFTHAVPSEVLGISVALCPAEELLWSSAFVQERERYDALRCCTCCTRVPSSWTGRGCLRDSATTGLCSTAISCSSGTRIPIVAAISLTR
jgi:hypothetical protein